MIILINWLLVSSLSAQPHNNFIFESDSIRQHTIPFKEINNLILLPVSLNLSDTLYFILDTGAENIILFSSEFEDIPIDTTNLRKVKVGGIGEGDAIEAYVSPGNHISVGDVEGNNLNLIYIKDDLLKFSDLLGHPVHGILGISIFKSFIVEINYFTKKVTFIRQDVFKPKRRYSHIDLEMRGNKPYIELHLEMHPRINLVSYLLVDLGESKPLSLYLDSHESIFIPEPSYYTNLGKGLTGLVNGRVARISGLTIDRYELKNILTAFPDVEDIKHTAHIEERNGSLGAGIIKRFVSIFDINNETLYLKRNGILRQPFMYDKTGLILVSEGENFDQIIVTGVIKGSAGDKAGLKVNDRIIGIGDESIEGEKLGSVLNIIEESGRKFVITVVRNEEQKRMKLRMF
ncbi:MAG: aspartyl protease family protein [Bacteroidetes bacterium]|nr:aspartyl protease family protein [Bacteroidota bacterium]